MNTLDEILDEAVKAIGKDSDRQLSLHIGVTPQTVSQWRQKKSAPDMYALMELQKILKRDARELSAIIEAERAKTEERRGYWEDVKRAFSTNTLPIALVAAMTLALLGGGEKPYVKTMANRVSDSSSVYYVKLFARLRKLFETTIRKLAPLLLATKAASIA